MARRRKGSKPELTPIDARQLALQTVLGHERRKLEEERTRAEIQKRRDTAHIQLATRILRYKFSFIPHKNYAELGDLIGLCEGNYLNQVVLRNKYFSDALFPKICARMEELEKESGLKPMPQENIGIPIYGQSGNGSTFGNV